MFGVAYGQGILSFDLPDGMVGREIHSLPDPPLPSPEEALLAALENPLESPPLSELVSLRHKVCIVVPDATRPFPVRELLPVVLDYLSRCGVPDEQVELALAYGLHRKLSPEEKAEFLGEGVVSRYRVVDHDAADRENLVKLGETSGGVPIVVHKTLTRADLILALGVVEPHQYAGYSGGAKTVAVGMAGVETISATHSIAFLDHPGTGLDRLRDNPFLKALWEIAARVPLKFIVNIIINEEGGVSSLQAGNPRAVHRDLTARAHKILAVPIPRPVDIIIGGVGYLKDVNLYQASRAVTYLSFASTSILKPDGVIIIAARAQEGVGKGVGERNFHHCFLKYKPIQTMMDRLCREKFAPGAQRAYMLGQALLAHRVLVVGSTCPEQVNQLGMIPFYNMEEALAEGIKINRKRTTEVLVVPHALHTLPVLASNPNKSG